MKLNDALAMQTFVAIPTSVSVADFALFFAAAEHIVGEDGGVDGQKTFAPYNGYVNLVRWFSYMQETYASLCASLNIEKVEFPFDSIDIHAPTPKLPESKKAAKKESKPAPKEPVAAAKVEEDTDCISKLDIRVGRIIRAWNHPDSDKLYCEEVDVGEEQPRQIGSGIRAFHTFDEMQGHRVCVLCNLKPRKLGGFPSNGMLLCACTEDHSAGALIEPPEGAKVGERVTFPGFEGEAATPAQVQKKKYVEITAPVGEGEESEA